MPEYEYKIVPFLGQVKAYSKEGAHTVAEQLQEVLNRTAVDRWEFYRIDTVQIESKPGCLGALLGGQRTYFHFDQVIFRRPKMRTTAQPGTS